MALGHYVRNTGKVTRADEGKVEVTATMTERATTWLFLKLSNDVNSNVGA